MTTKEKTRKARPRSQSSRRPIPAPAAGVHLTQVQSGIVEAPVCESPLLREDTVPPGGDEKGPVESCDQRSEFGDLVVAAGEQSSSEPGRRGPRNVRELIAIGLGQVELLSFRVGREMFAIDLACVEEAVESDAVHAVPDMPDAMLGVIELRGRLVPVFSPSRVLRAELGSADGVMLLMRAGDRRVGIAVDDVDDVITVDMPALRHPLLNDAGDGLLLGVAASGAGLVGILDGNALVAACMGTSLPEAT